MLQEPPGLRGALCMCVMLSCVTGKELNLAEDSFKLGHLVEAGLLKRRDAVEELTSAALKEEAIEIKLNAIATDWVELMLYFQDYKTRGPVILKAGT